MDADPPPRPPRPRFHGRVEGAAQSCAIEGCPEAGEFRAPPAHNSNVPADRPPQWRWLCLEHVRAFNTGYNFFSGMSTEEIEAAQRPYGGWDRETRAFSSNATSPAPKWQDFTDPLDAISAGFKTHVRDRMREAEQRMDGHYLSTEDRKALKVLGLDVDADRKMLRTRYTELARRYHPDHNGGDRGHEKALQDVIAAYTHLRKAPAFA